MKFNTSDWVQGKTKDGELIHGFIETIDILQGIVTVNVVKSDNEERVGHIVAVRASWIKRVPDTALEDAQLVQNLIDLALATWDEAWFMELTESLKSKELAASEADAQSRVYLALRNRLGKSA
ncbi:IDEAL domain-containing protein [Paenibacillus alkaliterrae]|uniref:IDEAL domain-containing protein n=1 Tax=Paenibacillus alkaliterrae TaxID=320909 RepID=UPI001F471BF4|nr:IDEAL domain-containing protein [Paenibacillus alkaliterrae]MCF2939727.1 IDEAL domain-containing protein [Paenibacillus alkaliterrae]